jgi:hypothetical protein
MLSKLLGLADPAHGNPIIVLDHKLRMLGCCLKSWSDKNMGNISVQIECVKELIFRFDVAQESRQLSSLEAWFHKELKKKYHGLRSLQKDHCWTVITHELVER